MSVVSSSGSKTSMGCKCSPGTDDIVMNNADYSGNDLCLGVTMHIQWDFLQNSSRPQRCVVPYPLMVSITLCTIPAKRSLPSEGWDAGGDQHSSPGGWGTEQGPHIREPLLNR